MEKEVANSEEPRNWFKDNKHLSFFKRFHGSTGLATSFSIYWYFTTHTQTHTHTDRQTDRQTHTHTHTHTHSHTHTHTHIHPNKATHTHTHTHTNRDTHTLTHGTTITATHTDRSTHCLSMCMNVCMKYRGVVDVLCEYFFAVR